ncbi:hypothetical protein [Campylobacter gracilis]|nr:hypothetical protein [Campylobacter gracilis]
MRGHTSRRDGAASAAPYCSTRPKPHLTPDDALQGAGYACAEFIL